MSNDNNKMSRYIYTTDVSSQRPLVSLQEGSARVVPSLYKEPEPEECKRCSKFIYKLDLLGSVMGHRYHKQCFRCVVCDTQLDFKNYRTNLIDINDRSVYCMSHYPRNGRNLDNSFNGYGSVSRSSEILNTLNSATNISSAYSNKSNDSLNKLNEPTHSVDSLEQMMNKRDYASHSIHESHHQRFDSEYKREQQSKHLMHKSNMEEILTHSKIEESHHHSSSSVENQLFTIITSPQPQYYIESDYDDSQFKSDFHVRPSIDEYDRNKSVRNNSLRDQTDEDLYSRNFSNHSHLHQIMKEIREKESYENQKYLKARELEKNQRPSILKEPTKSYEDLNTNHYTGAYSHLKEIFAEVLAQSSKQHKSSINSISSSRSSSSDKVFIDSKDRQNLNQVVSELMTADLNDEKYADQSPYLNGIMGEALAQNGMKTSISTYLSNKSLYSNSSLDQYRKIPLENTNSNDQQKKRITNGVAVLPVNFNDSIYKKSSTSKSPSIELVDYDEYYSEDTSTKNTNHLVDIMRDVILSNNEAAAKSVSNKKVENVLPETIMNSTKTNSQSSTSTTNKIVRQVAFEEVTTSSSKKVIEENSASKTLYHQTTDTNNSINIGSNSNSSNSIKNPTTSPQPPRRIEYQVPTIVDRDEIKNALPIGEDRGFGLVRLTIFYDDLRTRFSVTIHEARNLKSLDKKNLSDPYARVYLMPDEKPSLKRKTKIVKNNLNPIWQETFDYALSHEDTLKKELTVNLKDERGLFEKQESKFLGEVQIRLKSIDIREPYTRWFYLQPLNPVAKLMHNSGF